MAANRLFQLQLGVADNGTFQVESSCGSTKIGAYAPRNRLLGTVPTFDRGPDDKAKDRTTMIAASRALNPTVLGQTIPKRCTRLFSLWRVCQCAQYGVRCRCLSDSRLVRKRNRRHDPASPSGHDNRRAYVCRRLYFRAGLRGYKRSRYPGA